MLDMALDIFQADAGSVMLERDGYLKIRVSRGLDQDIVQNTRQKLGSGIAGWVAQTGKPVHLDGRVKDERFQHLVERDDLIASSLSVPISLDEKVVGVLMIRRASAENFGDLDLPFLLSVGDLAAVALQKARYFQAEREQRRLLELEHHKLSATFSSMEDGVLVLDENGAVLTSNRVALEYLSPSLGQDLGRFSQRYSQLLEHAESEVTVGERALKVLSTPLVVGGQESGSVLVIRDETTARELEKMKSEFLSMISHELKTPITTISAFLELLLVRDFEKERREHFLGICSDECGRLQSLIDQLLHLTRLEAGRFILEKKRQDLGELIRNCVPAFSETSPKHQLRLVEPFPNARLEFDPTLIVQAVTNLLSNALKYSPEGGEIRIALGEEKSSFVLSVSDEGVGIEAEKLKLVFEKFYRVDNSLTRSTGGTGLGLANVKHIALAHNGRVWVESKPGHGSTFYLELPKESGDQNYA